MALAAGLVACSGQPPASLKPACLLPDQSTREQVTLYFGLTRPDGGAVGDAQWRDFMAREVTPRFADGLTEIEAEGQWRDRVSDRIGREPSRILVLVAARSEDLGGRVQAIRTLYRQRFAQQSVGIVTQAVCAGF